MGWEVAILEALGKWHSSPGSMWVVGTPGCCGWWSQVPQGMMQPLPGSSWTWGCVWGLLAQRSPAWVFFRSYCCFCCWENSNHLEFPCLETLPCTVALGPKTALLTLVWTITEQGAVDHQPLGIIPNGESAPFLGMPSARGGCEKAGKGEGFKESLCCQKLQLQMFGKTFFKGLEQGDN